MDEERKYAILFAPTILAARKLNETGTKACPARDAKAVLEGLKAFDLFASRWRRVEVVRFFGD